MSLEFTLSSVYLSPRAVERAREAGVVVLAANVNQMTAIQDSLRRNLGEEMAEKLPGLHLPIEETALVVRWGRRLGLSTDVRYHTKDKGSYQGAIYFNNRDNGAILYSKGEIGAGNTAVLEMSVRQWNRPQFGAHFAEALLDYGSYPTGILPETIGLLTEKASVDEAMKRGAIADCQQHFPLPLSTHISYQRFYH